MRFGGTWHDMLDDENATARFGPVPDVLQDLDAFAVISVVENHLEAIHVGFAGYFFEHIAHHKTTTLFQTKIRSPQLFPLPYYFR